MIIYEFTAKTVRVQGRETSVPVQMELTYDAETDPLAVAMTMSAPGDDPVTWKFARDLLVMASNSRAPVGLGDIRFRAHTTILYLCLNNGQADGHADLALPLDKVRGFLADTAEEAALPGQAIAEATEAFLAEVLG